MNRAIRLLGILAKPDKHTLRLLRGPYSQVELAAKLHIKPSTVSQIERGIRTPQGGTLRALLEHYVDWTRSLGWPSLELITALHAHGGTRKWQPTVSPPPPANSPTRKAMIRPRSSPPAQAERP